MPGKACHGDSSQQPVLSHPTQDVPLFLSFFSFPLLFDPRTLCRASFSLTPSPVTFQINSWHCFLLGSFNSFFSRQKGPGICFIGKPLLKELPDKNMSYTIFLFFPIPSPSYLLKFPEFLKFYQGTLFKNHSLPLSSYGETMVPTTCPAYCFSACC